MIRTALITVVMLAGCRKAPEKKVAEPAQTPATEPPAPAPATEPPAPATETETAPAPAAAPVPSAEEAALVDQARALETRAVFPKPVKKPFVPMQDRLIDYVSKIASNPSPAVTVGPCKAAPDARCVFIDAPCTGGCDVNGMSVWLRREGDQLVLDTALLGDVPIKSEADIDAVYREIDGE